MPGEERIENPCCQTCTAMTQCRNITRRYRNGKFVKSGFVVEIVRFATLHGDQMRCLTVSP